MATALLGQIESFDPTVEEWPQYVERLSHFFEANGITGDGDEAKKKRKATFLSVVGRNTYTLLRSLVAPVKPAEKSLEELIEVLSRHYSPKPTEVMQRFRFNSRSRKDGESIADYVAELRRLAEFCNYGDTLNKMLRDRLVWGVKDPSIQKKLLSESELTLTKAVQLAQSSETAEQNLREMEGVPLKDGATGVNRVFQDKRSQAGSGNCFCCGAAGHMAASCPFRDRICHKCKRRGHLKKMCGKRGQTSSNASGKVNTRRRYPGSGRRPVRQVDDSEESEEDDLAVPLAVVEEVRKIRGAYQPPLKVPVKIDSHDVLMELDTGASVSIMSETQYKQLWPGRGLRESQIKLQTYSKQPLVVVGSLEVQVCYESQEMTLPLVIVRGNGPTLLGRDWFNVIKLNWAKIHYLQAPGLQEVLEKHSELFNEGLGTFKGQAVTLEVDPDATPHFSKARPLPYAMRELVETELQRLVNEGTLEPVDYSEWAAPIVAVLKSDRKSVRICGDFRTTVNPVSKLHRYPIPKVEDLFANLAKGKVFSKLDLTQAYQQLKLDPQSQKFVVINTHKGLFKYTRLPFGIASAPGIFQKTMETLLQGIPGVSVFIDDILIATETKEEHLKILEQVLQKLASVGLRAKRHKCKFMVPAIEFLGHLIDGEGIHPLPDKIVAIQQAPSPTNLTELKSYIGLLSYYGKFLPHLSTCLAPMYHLLGKGVTWKWTSEQEAAFRKSKVLLTSAPLLVHYNPDLPLLLACDASAYGLGAVLAHRMPDGSEKPIAYVSRTLNSAERNYSQIEKEGLACVFGVKRFYAYLFGRHFTLVTDHKPLLSLLSGQKPTSIQASARIRRWSLYLSMFDYVLRFRRTAAHANADALSRLPLSASVPEGKLPPELVLLVDHLNSSPVTARQICKATSSDPQLSSIVQFVQQGWPSQCPEGEGMQMFFERKEELSVLDGCLLWGARVVVPKVYRACVLSQLHEGHPGTSRMKTLSRMYVWWPGITRDLENTVKDCLQCQKHQSTPPTAPLHVWAWPSRPWARLHIDYAGPVEGKMVLIIVDAHSKWVEAIPTNGSTSNVVIEELRTLFSRFGLPESIVSDNGTCFTSLEFESFLKSNGISHLKSAPYHPATNGLAERAVQIVKRGLRKIGHGSFRTRLAQVLFAYRLTPQTTTGLSPSELLLGRRTRSLLDLLKPNTAARVESRQAAQVKQHNRHSRYRSLEVGDLVFVRNYHSGDKWLPGEVLGKTGSVSFRVRLQDGRIRHCHLDQLRLRSVDVPHSPDVSDSSVGATPVSNGSTDSTPELSSEGTSETVTESEGTGPESDSSGDILPRTDEPVKVYPKRARKTVDRFEPKWTDN